MNEKRYWVLVGDKEEGPYSLRGLRELMECGRISGETLYACDGDREWRPVRLIMSAGFGDWVEREMRGLTFGKVVLIAGLGFAVMFFTVPAVWMLFRPDVRARAEQRNWEFDAYHTAKDFLRKRYPGVISFSDFGEAIVERDGSVFRVAIWVDGENVFGAPLKRVVGVEMKLEGSQWKLVTIDQP